MGKGKVVELYVEMNETRARSLAKEKRSKLFTRDHKLTVRTYKRTVKAGCLLIPIFVVVVREPSKGKEGAG